MIEADVLTSCMATQPLSESAEMSLVLLDPPRLKPAPITS